MGESIGHNIERAAFSAVISKAVKNVNQDRAKYMIKYMDLAEKALKGQWKPQAFERMRNVFRNPDSKWMQYTNRMFDNVDPEIIKMAALNLAYEAGFRGFRKTIAEREKFGCDIPWILLFDPTSSCNLHCTGCWAAEYGHQKALSNDDMDSIVTQAEELGIHAFLLTGGEPLMRKYDILDLCKKHNHSAFMAFTNGTLIDDEFCEKAVKVANFVPAVSVEGFQPENDGRRGDGSFDKVMKAFDTMKRHKMLFGTSICYTSKNYKTVTSDDFLDMLIEKGVMFTWYFHYMPVGNDAATDLLLNPEQREYMYHRVREIRAYEGGKQIMAVDFQNDGEYVSGCIAGGKYYCHINPAGDVEPCVFIHYSNANIHEKSLLECLQQPLFKEYQKAQPFNENKLMPCPMLENPECLQKVVKAAGAHSTDMDSPEDVEHLCSKCVNYSKEWAPVADKLWKEYHFERNKDGDAAFKKELEEVKKEGKSTAEILK